MFEIGTPVKILPGARFGGTNQYRFIENFGDPTTEGEWVIVRTVDFEGDCKVARRGDNTHEHWVGQEWLVPVALTRDLDGPFIVIITDTEGQVRLTEVDNLEDAQQFVDLTKFLAPDATTKIVQEIR